MNIHTSFPSAARGSRPILFMLLAGAVLAACSTGVPSEPTASPSPTPVAEWTRFTSDRYGYAIDHPVDWIVQEKPGSVAFEILRPYNGGADLITTEEASSVQARDGFQLAAAEVPRKSDLVEFTNDIYMPCGGPSIQEEITLSGEPALWRRFRCNSNRPLYVQVTAIHEGVGYVLWFMSSERPHADDRPTFTSMLESFEFTDAAATAAGRD